MNSSRQHLAAGTIIGDRYSIVKLIGQGGMALVYLANDQQGGGSVAVKVMKSDLSHDQEFIKRFDTEARAASSLDHPNIVKVLDYGQDGDLRYIVQELVEGPTLKDLIQERGALPWATAVPLAIQIGLALEHAHKRGVVHRDIKPHNILITRDMAAKVTDFGIARAVNANTITLTSGMTLGSVHYFSPEQARGSIVSEKSDIYSLGIMLYEMITGQVPFDGETSVAIAIKHLQEMPPLPSTINAAIPTGLDSIIVKCIQKSPDNRYSDARELVDELDAFMVDPKGIYGVLTSTGDRDGSTTAIGLKRPDPNYGKLREIERTINDRRRSRQRDLAIVFGIVLLSLVFLVSIGVWAYQKISEGFTPPTDSEFTIENYIGQDVADVEQELKDAKIKYKITFQPSDVEVGVIIDQDPPGPTVIKVAGTTILNIFVSAGQETITLENYSSKTYEAAKNAAESLGFVVNRKDEPSNDFKVGTVIKTDPPAGTEVIYGSTITLVVCSGATTSIVPDLTGMLVQEVETLFGNIHLTIGTRTNMHVDPVTGLPAEVPLAQQVVIKQSIAPNTEVKYATLVNISYGTAQDLYNYQNPTPTPEPTPEPTPTTVETTVETTAAPTAAPTPVETTTGTTTDPGLVEPTKKNGNDSIVGPVLLTVLPPDMISLQS